MSPRDKPLVWLRGEVKTPPLGSDARIEATPKAVLTACQRRLGEFQRLTATMKGAGHAKR